MEFVHSNLPALKMQGVSTFYDKFNELAGQASELDIAVGYVTADSLVGLQTLIECNSSIKHVNLIIGMHYWDLFTKVEYNTALSLNDYLRKSHRGEVRMVTPFRYHGKLYSYSNNGKPFAGIIGSNNLSSIVKRNTNVYESSLVIDDCKYLTQMNEFMNKLSTIASKNIYELNITKFKKNNSALVENDDVKKVSPSEYSNVNLTEFDYSFEIKISTAETASKSNINTFFGKGRKNPQGLICPRPWYEVELIVPKNIATSTGYPKRKTPGAEFDVITDDGWTFRCKVSGDYNKNLRSQGDLEILGRWLKGRMESAGVLKPGNKVTEQTLRDYGRDNIRLAKIKNSDKWYLDFGVKK